MSERPSAVVPEQKALIGASIPRSGHHFLQTLLSQYFRDEMFYCEFYSRADCCRSVPCTRRGSHFLTYQKSHDRKGEVPKDIEEALYVIQYREPVGEAVSDRELDMVDHVGRKSLHYRMSHDHYAWWLAVKAAYYRDFHDKWFTPRLGNAVYLDYASLSSDPAGAIATVAHAATGEVDQARIERAVDETASTRAGVGPRSAQPSAYVPRKVESSPYFDGDLLAAYEDFVLDRCPNFGFERTLRGSYREQPFYGLVLLYDEREPLPDDATDRLQAAARLAPSHPEILLRSARRHMAVEDPHAAIVVLEALIARNPYFGSAYKVLFEACEKVGKSVTPNRIGGNALFACSDNPEALLQLAQFYVDSGMRVNAIATLSFVITLEPENFRAALLLARVLADERQWRQAELQAERAITLKPKHKELQRLLTRIRRHLGKTHVHLVGETAAEV
ncbi:MAG TPA: tetratricopeptide repeat protein [Rhizomicrobium sp.]|jgi:tetratricopeptide (TPR) repeat protein